MDTIFFKRLSQTLDDLLLKTSVESYFNSHASGLRYLVIICEIMTYF